MKSKTPLPAPLLALRHAFDRHDAWHQSHILVGLSGGPDSVVLLHTLLLTVGKEQLLALHCNFHLRGEESMRDEAFCRNLCQQLGVDLQVVDFDTRSYMAQKHLSLEMAARELRYDYWEKLALQLEQQTGRPVCIAVGHHRDDCIETALMNLMRGTGIKGLTGIPEVNGRIIRPLLNCSRQEILDYLQREALGYITDSTNLENDTLRNQIRNQLLPLMTEILPQSREGIYRTLRHLQQSESLAESQLNQLFATTRHFDQAGVQWEEWCLPENLTDEEEIESLLHEWSQRHPGARRLRRLFYTEMRGTLQEAYLLPQRLSSSSIPLETNTFDLDRLSLPLQARHWQQGDRIQPLGMKGSRLVSDLFTDAHLTPNDKATRWLITDASGRILWIPGLRMADWCKLSPQTRQTLTIDVSANGIHWHVHN